MDRQFIIDTLTRAIAELTEEHNALLDKYSNGDFYSTEDAYTEEYQQGKLTGLEYALQLITDTEAFKVGRLGYIETKGNDDE